LKTKKKQERTAVSDAKLDDITGVNTPDEEYVRDENRPD